MMGGMVRRWVIRGLGIFLCVVCVGVWVGSYWRGLLAGYDGHSYSSAVVADNGFGWLCFVDPSEATGKGWDAFRLPASPALVENVRKAAKYHFIGFAFKPDPPPRRGWIIFVPLWFPTLVSAAALWFIWRKTRVKGSKNAFPVEVKGEGASQ